MEDRRIRVAITHGDTNGVGYELIFKTFAEPEMLELCTPIVYGSPKVATYHRNALHTQANFSIINRAEEARDNRINMIAAFDEEIKVELGTATPESEQAARKALDCALADAQRGAYDVLVTTPSAAKPADAPTALTLYVNDFVRIASMTGQMPLKEATTQVTPENVKEKATTLFNTLRRDFSISNPRVAILALNPKAEDGSFGKEEQEVIVPAIKELMEEKIQAFGPYTADAFFGNGDYEAFDGILAMHYEQALTPFKAISTDEGVEFVAGQELIRTAPILPDNLADAGKGITDEMSFRHAIYAAMDAFRNRNEYDIPFANSLKKLYRERKDDSEKVRFSIPKKHENKEEQNA